MNKRNDETMKMAEFILKSIEPKMLIKDMAPGTFVLVPFKYLNQLCYDPHHEPWQYAFVNVKEKTYKMVFKSFEEFVDAVVQCDEIWYGSEKHKNPLYGSRELLLIKMDMGS